MIAMRYGTLPIVRETGGLKDTVLPYNEYEDTGYAFSFTNYNAHDMLYTIDRALGFYEIARSGGAAEGRYGAGFLAGKARRGNTKAYTTECWQDNAGPQEDKWTAALFQEAVRILNRTSGAS